MGYESRILQQDEDIGRTEDHSQACILEYEYFNLIMIVILL